MKKLYTLTLSLVAVLFACATALSASAAGSVARQYARYATDSDLHHNTNLAKGEFKSRDAQTTVRAAKAFAPASRVTDIPAGEDVLYECTRMCLMFDYIVDNDGLAGTIRYCDNNKVYFYDMFSLGEAIYIEGSIDENGLITIPTHQFFANDSKYGEITIEISKFITLPNGNTSSDIFFDKDAFYLQRHDDGTITAIDADKDWMDREYLVLCNKYGEVMALSGNITMTPVTAKPVSLPSDAKSVEYIFKYTENNEVYAQICSVVFDNNDVYIKGMCHYFPETWLKATFNDDHTKLIMKSGQFLASKLYVNYFSAAHRVTAMVDGESKLIWEKDPELVMEVSEDGKTFTFERNKYFTITIADIVDYAVSSGSLSEYTEKLAKPATPIISGIEWIDVDALFFSLPPFDVDGNLIDIANLSWRMYYDDELFTFTPDDYMYLEEELTEIPYLYDDDWDFGNHHDSEQFVAIYNENYKNIGIESVYTLNGESSTSDRAYYGEHDGVSNVTDVKTVVSTDIYTLSGVKVSGKLAPGLYIRTETYSDGSRRTLKTIVR